MPRRTPNGETDIEVLADYARKLERRLTDLEGMVAGRLPHDHDARYVETAGDTMTGVLVQEVLFRVDSTDGNGDTWQLLVGKDETIAPSPATRFEVRKNGSYAAHFSWREDKLAWFFGGDVEMDDALTVNGAKNAVLADPADPTRAYHYAAMEADEPGLLAHRWLNVHVDREATLPIPDHWDRIARDPMVMVSHADEPDDSSPRAPFGWADLGAGQVTVRAPTGDYHVLLVACRSDLDGRWSHEVAVDPEQDDEV